MENTYSVVSCASFGSSGSGVVTDFLSEFENIYNPGDYEFRFLQDYDGITTLEDCLVHSHHRLNSDIAIKNFIRYVNFQCGDFTNKRYNKFFKGRFGEISKQFLDEIIEIEWPGYWEEYQILNHHLITILKYRVLPRLRRLLSRNKKYIAHYLPREPMYFANPTEEKFHEAVKRYVNRLCQVVDPDHSYKYVYFDQLLPPTNIDRYFNYFDDLHVIVVDRDPRDWYIENVIKWGEGWIPKDLDKYIKLYKGLRDKINQENENPNILRVQFEDMIFKYDEISQKIMDFLDLSKNTHTQPFKGFDPNKSVNNAQIWKKITVDGRIISTIENELSDYLYQFPESYKPHE